MKYLTLLLLLVNTTSGQAQTEDWYGPVTISFHGFICNRPTNDNGLGGDGVGDEVSVQFFDWTTVSTNRASYNGITKIYGEDFYLPFRVKAGTATINGGLKAGDSYYRGGSYGDDDPLILSNYSIVTTFCAQNTVIAILPAIFERDEGPLGVTTVQDFGVVARRALNDDDIHAQVWDFSDGYVYDDSNPYGFMLPGRYIGLDAKFAGMFIANKNKLASRPIGLFSNWDYSSQLIVLTPKTIKIISEKDYGYGKGILPVFFNEESMENTEGHGNYIVLLRFVSDIKNRNAGAAPLYSVGVNVNSVNAGEVFKFRLHSGARWDSVTINSPNTTVNFQTKIASGQQYHVTQISGPRNCQLTPFVGNIADRDILVTASCSASSSSYKVGIGYSSSLFPHNERYEFSLNGTQKVVLDSAHQVAYFPQKLNSGQTYSITQTSGPRICNFYGNENAGTITDHDILLNAECGNPPLSIFKINIVGVGQGESFNFADNYGRSHTYPFSALGNLGGFPVGSYYSIVQTTGPRACKLTSNQGMVPDNSVTIQANCRKPAVPVPPPAYVYDLVSRSTDDKILSTYYESFNPVIGGQDEDDGRYVAFGMYGKGIDGSTGNYRQVFWRDRKTGITKLVSKTPAGEEGNNNSLMPAISADGKSVAFESYATNLCGEDNNGVRDVFVWNESSGRVTLVSKSQQGGTANGESYEPTISGNGSVIAYTSNASDIVRLEPVFSTPNVYVYTGGNSIFITKDYETGKAAGGYSPSISEDGSKIAFCAYTSRLVENDNNNLWDIFLWESGAAGLKRISLTASGAERNQGTESASRVVAPSISGDGGYVVYATTASNMVPGDNNEMQDIFICSTSGGDVRRMSSAGMAGGNGDSPIGQGERIGISYDGTWITYNTNADNLGAIKGNIVVQNSESGKIKAITNTTNGSTARPMISPNGNFVVAGCSEKYDKRFPSSGIFVFYTGH